MSWWYTTEMLLVVSFDLFETLWRCTDGTLSFHPLETSWQHSNKMLWRCTTETSWQHSTETLMGLSFETYLQYHWDIQGDIFRLSSQHLVAGWDIILIQGWPKAMVLDCLYKPFYHEINWKYHCLISRPVHLKQMQRIIVSINIKKTLHYKK